MWANVDWEGKIERIIVFILTKRKYCEISLVQHWAIELNSIYMYGMWENFEIKEFLEEEKSYKVNKIESNLRKNTSMENKIERLGRQGTYKFAKANAEKM